MLIATFLLALPLMPVNAAPPATISISPGSINTAIGGTFSVNIILSGSPAVIGYDVRVTVNPDVLTVTSASLSGTLLDPATNNVLIARQQVFPSIGFVRYALVTLGGASQTPNPSASLLSVTMQVNDPSAVGSIATASEYPASIELSAEVVGVGAVNIPVTATGATYMPSADVGLRNTGCRAANDGFNTFSKGLSDPLFCRIVSTGAQSISVIGVFSYRSIGGVTGSTSSAPVTLAPGQAGQVDSTLTVPNANDIFIVTGTPSRVISFQDGSVLAIPGPSSTFKIVVNVP